MDLGTVEVQIFVGLALVLGTIFVALVCDFLKGNNETLRERNIELTVRQQERERWEKLTAAAKPPADNRAGRVSQSATTYVQPGFIPEPAPPPEVSWAGQQELEQVERMADRIRKPHPPVPGEREPGSTASERPSGHGGVADGGKTLFPEADPQPDTGAGPGPETTDTAEHETAGQPTSTDPVALAVRTKATPIEVIAAEHAAASEALQLAEELEQVAEMTAPPPQENSPSGILGIAPERTAASPETGTETAGRPPVEESALVDGNSGSGETELENQETPLPPPSGEEGASQPDQAETAAETGSEKTLSLPTGFQDLSALSGALSREAPFTGTIVAIGVGKSGAPQPDLSLEDDLSSTSEVIELLQSLMKPADFGCQTSTDEYLLILPGETGVEAERRLRYISEQLWDFQIRSVSSCSIMFSWGAAEVAGDSLAEGMESAKERMHQTKRSREKAPQETHHYRLFTGV